MDKPKPFSMIREFHLADWFTLANAFCGVGALFAVMTFLQTGDVRHIYFACWLIPAALVEDLPAQGKDASELARDIEKALGKFIRDPVVTVIVTNFVGPYDQQIRVVGEVPKPQTLPFKQAMTLLDVMIAVGGVTDFADGNAATILRPADGNKQYHVRVKDLVKRGDVSANVQMQPGDVLFIPQSWF
mgnify:CR=1 FL=1